MADPEKSEELLRAKRDTKTLLNAGLVKANNASVFLAWVDQKLKKLLNK